MCAGGGRWDPTSLGLVRLAVSGACHTKQSLCREEDEGVPGSGVYVNVNPVA